MPIASIGAIWFAYSLQQGPTRVALNTECLQDDGILLHQMGKLKLLISKDQLSTFAEAVKCADCMLFKEIQLLKRELDPCIETQLECFADFKCAQEHLETLVRGATSVKASVHIHHVYQKIYDCLQVHWVNIMRLTRVI